MKNKIFIVVFFGTILCTSPIMVKKILPASLFINEVETNEPIVVASNETKNDIISNVKIEREIEIKKEILNEKVENNVEVKNEEKEYVELIDDKTNVEKEENIQKTDTDNSYFSDALFIGDSRTVGIGAFGNIKNATFFANTGMSIYNLPKTRVSIDGVGKVSLKDVATIEFKDNSSDTYTNVNGNPGLMLTFQKSSSYMPVQHFTVKFQPLCVQKT